MTPTCGLLAWGIPGPFEWTMILGIGLLLFGRRLPEVGRAIGKTMIELRRGLQNFKDEIDSDGSLTDARSALTDLRDTIKSPQILEDPRKLLNPKNLFDDLTDTTRTSDGPESTISRSSSGPLEDEADEPSDSDADPEKSPEPEDQGSKPGSQ